MDTLAASIHYTCDLNSSAYRRCGFLFRHHQRTFASGRGFFIKAKSNYPVHKHHSWSFPTGPWLSHKGTSNRPLLTQAKAGADIAQPFTPPARSVLLLNPSDPLLMCEHGQGRCGCSAERHRPHPISKDKENTGLKELFEPTNGVAGIAEKPKSIKSKPPLPLPLCFMLSHLEEDGPVRLDGVKLGVCEVMGLELDEPKLGAFAGALNALDFPAQLLVRQHPPGLKRLRQDLQEAQPDSLPPQTKAASESLRRLLTDLEKRDGILDRRFYAVCEFGRIDELRGLLARAGLSVHPLRGRQLRMLLLASALGGTPAEFDEDAPVEVEINRRDMRVGGTLVRSLHLGKWPRSLAPGFLQSLMAAGAPMGLSIHLGPIPAEQAARTLEWQKVRFESAQSLSFKRGRTMSPEAEIALEDITRLRDEVQRGRERLFRSSLSITLHVRDASLARSNSCERQGANYQRGARDNSYHPEMDSIRAFL